MRWRTFIKITCKFSEIKIAITFELVNELSPKILRNFRNKRTTDLYNLYPSCITFKYLLYIVKCKFVCKMSPPRRPFYPDSENDTDLAWPAPPELHEETEARHCRCEVWLHLVATTQNLLELHIPTGKGQILHSADRGKHQRWLYHRWSRDRVLRWSIKLTMP
jgi:hypothetical protein